MPHLMQLIDLQCTEFPPAPDARYAPIIAPTKAQAIMGATQSLLKNARNVVSVDLTESKTHVRIVGLGARNTVIIGYMITAV